MPKIGEGKTIEPYWRTRDDETVRYYLGDVRDVLARLPAKSVQCVVTSPPYWGLRSYLDKEHEHKGRELGSEPSPDCGSQGQAQCGRCFVCNLVAVFRGVHRVLRDDGTAFLNLGDSYASGNSGGNIGGSIRSPNHLGDAHRMIKRSTKTGLPSGNLVGVPWRVALALQADGWILRQDIIWAKPSPMPESVKNRCTKSHEYVFLLAKGKGYYFDAEAIKTEAIPAEYKVGEGKGGSYGQAIASGRKPSSNGVPGSIIRTGNLANKRSVWTIATQPYPGAHFACFPMKLIEPMILAGSRKGDIVLDPFIGSGTTAAVCVRNGRRALGIDLSRDYLDLNAIPRVVGELMDVRDKAWLVTPPARAVIVGREIL